MPTQTDATFADADVLDLITAQHLITAQEPDSEAWEASDDERLAEWAGLCLKLGAERDPARRAEVRGELGRLAQRILGNDAPARPVLRRVK